MVAPARSILAMPLPPRGRLAVQATTGTSRRRHGRQRAGDGGSPAARRLSNILPEPLPERRPRPVGAAGSARDSWRPSGRRVVVSGRWPRGRRHEGWYRGAPASSLLRRDDDAKETITGWASSPRSTRTSTSPPWTPGPSSCGATARCSSGRSTSGSGPSRSSSTRGRRPPTAGPACTTWRRGSSRTCSPASRPCAATGWTARAAGTATACRSSWRSRRSWGSRTSSRSSATGWRPSTPAAASR